VRFFKRKPKPSPPKPTTDVRVTVGSLQPEAPSPKPAVKKPTPEPPKFQEMERLPKGVEPIKSRKYTAEEVDTALLCLAVHGGQSFKAQAELAGRGIEISDSTLRMWKARDYPERYRFIQEHHGSQLEDVLVRNQREVAVSATLKALEGLDSIDLEQVEQKDRAKAVQALQTTAGIATDKVLTLTGRPTQVTEHRSAEQVLRKYGGTVIDVEHEELTSEPSATPRELSPESGVTNAQEA
jgi:hypothetical protein